MAEPAAKKAKTEEAGKEAEEPKEEKAEAAGKAEEAKEPQPPPELEEDAKADKMPKIKDPVVFHTQDTTMNVMQSALGSILMPLTDGGLQYLLAGARANTGVKSGRYSFEVKIVEVMDPADDPAARQRTPMPRCQLRVGFSASPGSLFLGDTEDSVCFDTEGAFIHNKARTTPSQRFGADTVVTVVLNLDGSSPNANTLSLFKDGQRACQPQQLPAALRGKSLYPAVTFKNLTVHYNFGPAQLAPLPFKCRMLQQAATKDVNVAPAPAQDGKREVVFPVSLPDEGGFDWLDMFLEKNPTYTELSDRAILNWAEMSHLTRPKGYGVRSSHDKPEMGFGISVMDDGSIRRVLQAVAPVQDRSYVVMEAKSNLVKEERKDLASKWASSGFKRIAAVMLGEPPAAFKKRSQDLLLKQKQEVADIEFRAKQAEDKRKKALERRQKQLERERRQAMKKQKRAQEELKKKLEIERKKKEAAERGEEYKEDEEDAKEEDKDEDDDEEEEEKEDEAMDEEPPLVQLTAEEKKMSFRRGPIPDLTSYVLNTSFTKFSLPDKDEGFEELRFEWNKGDKCRDYLKQWVQEKKTTTRIEDLQPGDWFTSKWKEWQKTLQSWHAKQNGYKAALAQKAAQKAAKQAKRAAAAAAKEAREKAAAEKRAAEEKAAAEKAEAAGDSMDSDKKSTEAEAEKPAEAPMEEDEEEEEKDDGKVDFDKLDVFGVEDILDVGGGEPLFSTFGFEDWTMMSLRFELHLLAHSFKRDVNDTDRIGIHVEHLAFYYNKYFKKALNHKFYGVETIQELLDLTRDTVVISRKGKVVEPQLPDDMESLGIFVMLTEEARRDRVRRVDLGDESARLKLSQPQMPRATAASAAAPGAIRPVVAAGIRPANMMTPQIGQARPATITPAWQQTGYRPPGAGMAQARPAFQPAWRPTQTWRG